MKNDNMSDLHESHADQFSNFKNFEVCSIEDFINHKVDDKLTIRGRIVQKRDFGKLMFFELFAFCRTINGNETAQISITRVHLSDFDQYKNLKRGDIVEASGFVYLTQRQELTLQTEHLTVLCRPIRELPDKWHGLKDTEKIHKLPFINAILNKEDRNLIKCKLIVMQEIPKYLDSLGFYQVTTPILGPVASGAAAKPFVTHHNALNKNMYLRIAPELELKKIAVCMSSFKGIYEMCVNFRNEGADRTHSPEFQGMEVYIPFMKYGELIEFGIEIVSRIYKIVQPDADLSVRVISLKDLLQTYMKLDPSDIQNESVLRKMAAKHELDISQCKSLGAILDKIYKCAVNQLELTGITVIKDCLRHPLAKVNEHDPQTGQFFQIIVKRTEVVKAYMEETDPVQQQKNFDEQVKLGQAGEEEFVRFDPNFIEALEYGCPPLAGFGCGIDRFISAVAEQPIRKVNTIPVY